MRFEVRLPKVEDLLASTTLDTDEITRVKRDALRQMHRDVLSSQSTKPDQLSDRFVEWNFRSDWATKKLPLGVTAGTDYDYFEAAIADCIQLFKNFGFPGKTDPDKPGHDYFGGLVSGEAYTSLYEVWQNGQIVTNFTGLRGPWVDFGPTADYALFLEKSVTRTTNNLGAPYLAGVGVLHAIADRLNAKYRGAMRIFAHTQRPEGGSSAAVPRKHRDKGQILTFPVIRIMHRHYRGSRRG